MMGRRRNPVLGAEEGWSPLPLLIAVGISAGAAVSILAAAAYMTRDQVWNPVAVRSPSIVHGEEVETSSSAPDLPVAAADDALSADGGGAAEHGSPAVGSLEEGESEEPSMESSGTKRADDAAPRSSDAIAVQEKPSGPPSSAEAMNVLSAALPLFEGCLVEAKRFDPSIGGKVTMRIELQPPDVRISMGGAGSPYLSSCIARKSRGMRQEASAPMTVEARIVLDGARGRASIDEDSVRVVTSDR